MPFRVQYSTFSHGSEGDKIFGTYILALQYSIFSHGSESKYAIAPLVLSVRENTIL